MSIHPKPEMVYQYSMEKYNTYDSEVADNVIDFIKRRAETDKPFFVNFWGKGNHFWGAILISETRLLVQIPRHKWSNMTTTSVAY